MGKLINNFDWTETALGPIENWPPCLLTSVNIILQSPVPLAVLWGQEGTLVYNQPYATFSGARHPALLGKKVADAWPEVEGFTSEFMGICLSGKAISYENQLLVLSRNGVPEDLWLDLNFSPIINEEGKPGGVLAIVVDNTERNKSKQSQVLAEEILEIERRKLFNLFMNAPAAIALISGPDLVYQLANEPYRELLGKDRSLLGLPLLEALPEIQPELLELVKKVAFSGESHVANELPVSLDWDNNGKPFTKYLNFVYEPVYENNRPNGLITFAYDVTEQVLARKRIEESENQMRVMADSMPQLVWSANPDGTVDYYNKKSEVYEGIDKVGNSYKWAPVLHPDDRQKTIDAWNDAICKGTTYQIEHRVMIKGKGFRWHLSRGVPIKGKGGKIVKWYGTATDIDGLKKIEEKLKLAQKEADLLMEKKDEFIGVASHELKTPLTTIKASLQITQKILKEDKIEMAEKLIHKTCQNVDKLSRLINDLLNVSKIQAGQLQLNMDEFCVAELIDFDLDQLGHQSDKHQIHVEGDLSARIVGDKYRLEQVMCNLLSNAIKYSPKADRVILSATKEAGFAKIAVRDFGIGIPQEKLNLVFERFFRVEETSYHYQGLGLGLHISKEIVERHGGKIWAHSEVGAGSVFTFTLPVSGGE